MTSVANAIAALLYDHETVVVTGLGAFLCHRQGAKVNVITNQFEKPSATLSFDPSQREENGLVADYLMRANGLVPGEAERLVAAFVADCFAKLKTGETVTIPEVGTLRFDEQQEIVFEAVTASDFNGDAFGLCDMTPKPVYEGSKTETPTRHVGAVPPVEKTKHDDRHDKNRGWIWWLLLLLLLAGVALWFFMFRPTKPEPTPSTPPTPPAVVDSLDIIDEPIEIITDTPAIPNDAPIMEIDTVEPVQIDTVEEPVAHIGITVPPAEDRAFIVGGCFAVEKNALNMAEGIREKGCADVFVMQWGTMYYVCYGRYVTSDEAKAALPEIWEKYNKKAWILLI